jgi:hypothetical protein
MSILPAALSEALGISLSEVMDQYYSESDNAKRDCLIGNALDRKRTEEEGEDWLWEEACKAAIAAEFVHHGREDDSL